MSTSIQSQGRSDLPVYGKSLLLLGGGHKLLLRNGHVGTHNGEFFWDGLMTVRHGKMSDEILL